MSGKRKFESEFEARVDEWVGSSDLDFGEIRAGARSLRVAVEPWYGDSWHGTFYAVDPRERSDTGLYRTPSRTGLCVVHLGTPFIGDVLSPSSFKEISTHGSVIKANEVVDDAMLLLQTRRHITAIGVNGVTWVTDRISIDSFEIERLENGWALGVADPDDVEPRMFRVEIKTGRLIGGYAV